ncbi:MAG: chorismate synthase [Pseudomonadota bacterium]
MAGNSFGQLFRITTFGESHGGAVGVVVDGCPPRMPIDLGEVQAALDRRRPGQGKLVSPRDEADRVECLSGLQDGLTLGTPVTLIVRNTDARPGDYAALRDVFRPSHADFSTQAKYGIRAASGGGRASARETIGRVAAGSIAEQVMRNAVRGIEIVAWVSSVQDIESKVDGGTVSRPAVETSPVRCPDQAAAAQMIRRIEDMKAAGDSVGGTIRCVVRGVPAGLGEPVFDKMEADLAKAMLSLPAAKGFEVGSGFAGTLMTGSHHNDEFLPWGKGGNASLPATPPTATNRSGGIQGGITNGADITMRVAFKPVASIGKAQATVNKDGNAVTLDGVPGRHDPCVLPRAVPMVEAMAWLVLIDHFLRNNSLQLSTPEV